MKTASLVLGIVGGVLAIIFAIVFIFTGALVNNAGNVLDNLADELESNGWEVTQDIQEPVVDAVSGSLWLIGILSVAGGILGIVGGLWLKRKTL